MRADARRNHAAVLEAGAQLLAERPTASMQEIADASGVGRTTVYRHFPAREDLVAALVAQVADEVASVNAAVVSTDRPAEEVLRELAAEIVALGRRWAFLRAQREEVLALVEGSDRRYREWVTGAQRRGEVRGDFDAGWVLTATRAVLTAAVDEEESLGAEEAGRLAGETLVSAFLRRP